MLKILTFSTLYPNAVQPSHGVFVENRLRHLVASGRVAARVIAPVPYFPFASPRFGRYGQWARVPFWERRHGIEICHPRYPVIPKIGMSVAAWLLYRGVRRFVRRQVAEHPVDLIDAHYFYPDGVAAGWLARDLGVPFVVTARGSDLTEIAHYPWPRRQIAAAAHRAAGLITVCEALKSELVAMGIAPERINAFRNGVDLEQFTPRPRTAAQARLGVSSPVVASVGHLIPRKGHDLVIQAVADHPQVTALIVGTGPEKSRLEALVRRLGLEDRVRFLGQRPHEELADIYSAADILVLASSREGWANVLLEAMACGTPVVATRVWGTAEVVRSPAAGLLVEERTASAISEALGRLLASPPDRAQTRLYAEKFDWQETTQNQIDLFSAITGKNVGRKA